MQPFITRALLVSVLLMGLATLAVAPVAADSAGAVFVGTNHNNTHPTAPPGEPANQVLMYRRAHDGTLSLIDRFDTGGQGSGPSIRFAGDGLGSSHSVQLSQDNRWLFVTNFASHDVTVFRVSKKKLKRTDLVSTRSSAAAAGFPNSVTQHGHLVYVLNSGGQGSITGFVLSNDGTLTPIPDSTRELNANQSSVRPDTLFNPTQVSFTPDGRQLVVTIKDAADGVFPGVVATGPGRVLVFQVDRDGRPSSTFTQTNLQNRGPFGFSFDRRGNLLAALFLGGPGFTGSAGSFEINDDGTLAEITPNVFNGQLDTCWLENNGRYAYAANYTSGNISSYRIRHDGRLTLLAAIAGTTEPPAKSQGSTPLDLRITNDNRYLYNILPGSGKVAGWRINSHGSLTKIGEFPITIEVGGVPRVLETINGDVAMCTSGPSQSLVPCEFGPGGSPAGIAAF